MLMLCTTREGFPWDRSSVSCLQKFAWPMWIIFLAESTLIPVMSTISEFFADQVRRLYRHSMILANTCTQRIACLCRLERRKSVQRINFVRTSCQTQWHRREKQRNSD